MRDEGQAPAPHPSLVPGFKSDENAICPGQSCPFSFFKAISTAFLAHFRNISCAFTQHSMSKAHGPLFPCSQLSTEVTWRIYLASRPHHRAFSLAIPPAGRLRWPSRPGRIRWTSRRLVFFKMMLPGYCSMYSRVARSSYMQHSCDDVTKMGLCDWFTN